MKAWGIAAILLLIGLLFYGVYSLGHSSGKAEVQALWDTDKTNRQKESDAVKLELAKKEEDHRTENRRITNELSTASQSYALAIATIQSQHTERLRSSEGRSAIYKRQAEGGAAERASLASHAAELDRSLEEGRSLVRELRITLEQRDEQIKSLADQIRNDRKLLTESSTTQ